MNAPVKLSQVVRELCVEWYSEYIDEAANGDPAAMLRLALHDLGVWGIPVPVANDGRESARRWLERAVKLGYSPALAVWKRYFGVGDNEVLQVQEERSTPHNSPLPRRIPRDCWFFIATFLSIRDVCALFSTHLAFLPDLISESLWQVLVRRDFGVKSISPQCSEEKIILKLPSHDKIRTMKISANPFAPDLVFPWCEHTVSAESVWRMSYRRLLSSRLRLSISLDLSDHTSYDGDIPVFHYGDFLTLKVHLLNGLECSIHLVCGFTTFGNYFSNGSTLRLSSKPREQSAPSDVFFPMFIGRRHEGKSMSCSIPSATTLVRCVACRYEKYVCKNPNAGNMVRIRGLHCEPYLLKAPDSDIMYVWMEFDSAGVFIGDRAAEISPNEQFWGGHLFSNSIALILRRKESAVYAK